MGVPVTLSPNMETLGCEFHFGVTPVPLENDDVSDTPCFATCAVSSRASHKRNNGDEGACDGLSP